jgi:cytochrome b
MRSKLVYDWPTRIFHWSFAIGFLLAFAIAKTQDEDSFRFPIHMLIGLGWSSLILFRILWGFLGSKHARFSGLSLRIPDLISYFKSFVGGPFRDPAGHNPASSWVVVLMLFLGSGLVLSGLLMINGQAGEIAEEIHEWCGNGFLILAGTHVAGVLIHLLRKKDGIAFSMLDGKKVQDTLGDGIPDARPVSGVLLAVSLIGLATGVYRSYDSPTRTLKIAGFTLVLGEAEERD